MMGIAARLAEFAAADLKLPAQTREIMRLSLFDWMVCGIAGREEPVSEILRKRALADGGVTEAALFGGGAVPARAAALVNGTVSHALDYDDTHFAHIGHPSVAVFPAAIALTQHGGDVIEAAAAGAEASVRFGIWLGRRHYQDGFHQTATAGAIGATVTAARMLGLDAEQTGHALGIAATKAAGLKAQFGTMGKPLNAGLAAETGVVAAMLAADGFVSNPQALDGPLGFGETHHGEGSATALEGLGTDWLMDRVSHKFHACCHGLHATLEAIATMDVPEGIEAVRIHTHPRWLTVCNQPAPDTGLGVKFSFRHVAAMALRGRDTARPDSFSDAIARDPALVDLREKVEVLPDAALSEMQTRVELRDGAGEWTGVTHDLDAPVDLSDRSRRLKSKGQAVLGMQSAARIWAACCEGDSPDVGAITELIAERT